MSPDPVPFEWQDVDSTLANLMLLDLSLEIGELNRKDEQQVRFLNMGNQNVEAELSERLQMQVLRSAEFAARTYALYCEVWRCQQKNLSPEFLRAVCRHGIRTLVSARMGAVTSEVVREQQRTGNYNNDWLKAVTESFRRDMEMLFGKWQRAAEANAKTLEYILAAAANLPAVDIPARELVYARTQLQYFKAKTASTEALRWPLKERSVQQRCDARIPIESTSSNDLSTHSKRIKMNSGGGMMSGNSD
jgi:hypothetical protein